MEKVKQEEDKENKTTITKNQKANIPTKDGKKYSFQYVDIAQIHDYLEENNMKYYQEIATEPSNGCDYIMTYRYINGKWEEKPKRGCKVVDAILKGVKNPAQEQGSALTYARRYSLLMAFGLATEDDDAKGLTIKEPTVEEANEYVFGFGKYKNEKLKNVIELYPDYIDWIKRESNDEYLLRCIELIEPTEKNVNDRLILMNELETLILNNDIDRDSMYKKFGVTSNSEMTNEQIVLAIGQIKKWKEVKENEK